MLISDTYDKLKNYLIKKYCENRDMGGKITNCCCEPNLDDAANKYSSNCDICKNYSQEEFDNWSKQ